MQCGAGLLSVFILGPPPLQDFLIHFPSALIPGLVDEGLLTSEPGLAPARAAEAAAAVGPGPAAKAVRARMKHVPDMLTLALDHLDKAELGSAGG